MTTNEKGMVIKPESLYIRENLKAKDIKEGDIIPITVTEFDYEGSRVCCEISSHVRKAFIRVENFSYPELHEFSKTNIPHIISNHIGKQVVAKVVTKGRNGDYELDRKVVMKDTINYLSDNLGTVVVATIDAIRAYGAFIDIGNGVESLLHLSEFSEFRYQELANLFKIGDQIEVRLLSFNPDTSRFDVSRKHVYQREILPCNSVQLVRILEQLGKELVFVEYNPKTIGIMDFSNAENFYGKYALCRIKKNTWKGFKADFISWDEN